MYIAASEILDVEQDGERALNRGQIELIASRVSILNECYYCTNAHAWLLDRQGKQRGQEYDLAALRSTDADADLGIEGGKELLSFVDAQRKDEHDRVLARQRLEKRLGMAAVIDAAAIVGNFERMNRIANGARISVDDVFVEPAQHVRDVLSLNELPSAKLPDA